MEKIDRVKKTEKRLKAIKVKLEDRLHRTEKVFAEAKEISKALDSIEKKYK
jgi:cell shape-determining protein MreC